MKYFLLLAIACMFSVLGVAQTATDTTYVEILYFHGRQRCVTCKAIEEHTKEVVNTDLSEWVKNGQLRFKEVDISTPEGEKLAEKYAFSFWCKVGEAHSAVRFCTSWATQEANVNELIADIEKM